MTAREKICALKNLMARDHIDYYLVFSEDYHASEYVGAHFRTRAWLSGFSGSAGTLLAGPEEDCLWTDGRYFLQAADQLAGSGITLQKMGEPGVPTILAYLEEHLSAGETVGFDGRCASVRFAEQLEKIVQEKQAKIVYETDLAGEIWADRPALSSRPVFELDTCYAGESRVEKIARMRGLLSGRDLAVISSLDDIAWLLNLRGDDVACNPVFLSYVILGHEDVKLYLNREILSDEIASGLEADGVTILPYDQIYEDVKKLPAGCRVAVDPARTNYALYKNLPDEAELFCEDNVTLLPKAIKNETECGNIKKAHVKDGVAVTRFMYWLKKNIGKIPMTEISVAEKLLEFRKEQEHFLEESFDPIMSFGPHGAIVHYSATPETSSVLEPESFLLSDTGGQYLEGTTDITRTFALGPLTEKQKTLYTAVLRGNLNLAAAHFHEGCCGLNLDYLAREPLWELGMDYNHGTGHGVGFLLNVHEGPNSIRFRQIAGRSEAPFAAGMLTSDEPGVYLAGEFGIRLENCILCEEAETTEYGRFLKFEAVTLVPFDLDAIDASLMSPREIRLLNDYHERVYRTIAPLLPAEEAEWLREATRPI